MDARYNKRMAKISMLIPDAILNEIDAQAEGNRTAFMVEAALERARRARREKLDRGIIASLENDACGDQGDHDAWEVTANDGLE
jgi:hypothetical protein